MLGADDTVAQNERDRAAADRRAEIEYARQVQDTFGGAQFSTAEELAERYAGPSSSVGVAERAGVDRSWAFGHVVVDEAQELSPMAWRLLMRRCPSRSFTIVGDVAQTGSAGGATSWADVLAPHVGERWTEARLTVNYRTPAQVMELAASVLAASGSTMPAPTSARVGRHEPAFVHVADGLPAAVADLVARTRKSAGAGTLAVITSRADHGALVEAVASALPDETVGADSDSLSSPVSVLTVLGAKGLEFDHVVIAEPAAIVDESPRGLNDLYVALTRPTQQLHVVHARNLPAGFSRESSAPPSTATTSR